MNYSVSNVLDFSCHTQANLPYLSKKTSLKLSKVFWHI